MDRLSYRRVVWAKSLAYGLGIFILLSLPIKFWYLFSGETLSGWDTPGHIVLAKEFAKQIQSGSATGWSDVWFGGFPIFYFYPPFYYFLVYQIHFIFSVSIESAFSVSIFLTIISLFYSIYLFGKHFLWSLYPRYIRVLLGFSAVLFYFSYAGEGLQGTSLVGIVEGTVISSFSHSLILFGIVSLDNYRKSLKSIDLVLFSGLTSIIFYSHLLSSIFYCLILVLYFFEYRLFVLKNLRNLFLSSVLILFLIIPVGYSYFHYSEYTSGVFYGYAYPPLLSILGKDVYDVALLASTNGENLTLAYGIELFRSGRWLSFVALFLFLFNFRKFHNSPRSKLITTITLVFFWLSLDYSLGYILPNFKIHNYRAFDCFFIAFSILFPFGIRSISGGKTGKLPLFPLVYFVVIVQFVLFLNFDPTKYQKYSSPLWSEARTTEELELYGRLAERLKSLPKEALVQPEIVKSKLMFGTPHFWLPLLYNAGLRNNLGLTVESSYYSTLVFHWQEFGFGHCFRWGTDVDWRDSLISLRQEGKDSGYYLDFLLRSGVTHLVGFTPEYHNYLEWHRDRIQTVAVESPFTIVKILPNSVQKQMKPIGLIHSDLFNSNSDYGYRDFLKTSNFLQMHLNNAGYRTKIIRINRKQLEQIDSLAPYFSAVVVMSKEKGFGENSFMESLSNKVPSVLIQESELLPPKDDKTIKTLNLFLNQIRSRIETNSTQSESHSFFKGRVLNSVDILLDDTGREFILRNDIKNAETPVLPSTGGVIYLIGMVLSFLLVFVGIILTKISYFSFSKTNR
ncbi:hypothetical protein EHQ23_04075 [Leptospira bourretii]|uniref:Membrane protein 6-pyruvoyl-tetrahydropterin synthase-related domain-containing protein n=1 Tax=Leptospira bourretii TaxID=2484962 RepID=A0A4R9IHS0_9LEPT|nr:hypothetical protein [Leptospira bourretii]TGK88030.1 hypothetical protein EHQ23_04075 [Leptospira bourretii]TGK88680.1 hypothetical protein EHQ26_16600 [Leptospira bourretii]TGL20483.1 hypothetical protein EHQ47_13100 [Leptospira bourretii]TGL27377.1 hypothetical protein EHQ45_18100 [Leptospira bourretii]